MVVAVPVALPPCFHLADEVFPRVRERAARELVAAGWSQTRTAEALRVSQAMVSRYLTQPTRQAADEPLVARLTDDLLSSLRRPPETAASAWCDTLQQASQQGSDEALQDILAAEAALLAANPLALVPQIGLNLARAVKDATTPAGVVSYPARFVAAGDRIVSPAPPAYGASRHLAGCLLRVRARQPRVLAMASIRGGPTAAAAARLGWPTVTVDRRGPRADETGGGGNPDPDEPILAAMEAAAADPRVAAGRPVVVHDPGAIGIEACLYVGGTDAAAVVDHILRIREAMET